jgi:hypothetical protein
MSIALLVITDGRRDCIRQTIPSALAMLEGPITRRVLYDDSGDPDHRDWLADEFPTFELIYHPEGRQGFGGAIRTAWGHLAHGRERLIWHAEDDFLYNRPVQLMGLAQVLDAHPHLVQMALRRQPWNEHERQAGGIIEQHPDAYTEHTLGKYAWLEHRLFLTTNPSLYRRTLCTTDWPEGPNSEGHFTHQLLRDGSPEVDGERVRFAFWGTRDSGEAVTHIGHERVGVGY